MAIVGTWDSLAEAQYLVTDRLLQGVVEEIIEEGQLVPRLPVMQLDAKILKYNRESTLPTADFYDINEELTSQANIKYTPAEAELKRIIAQWDLDNFLIKTYRDPNDMEAVAVQQCRKGVMRFVEDKLIYGDHSANAKEFDGMHEIAEDTAAMCLHQGSVATGAPLSLHNLDVLVDMVKPAPAFLLMNFNIKRRIDEVIRVNSSYNAPIFMQVSEGGRVAEPVTYYKGIPIVRTDYITQTESILADAFSSKTDGLTSSIFAVRLGTVEAGGLCLVTGSPMFEYKRIDVLEDKDAIRWRLVWYVTMALGSTKSLARLDGITDAEVTI